jgi:glycosyltransferase involved in cell wall biosynthesis
MNSTPKIAILHDAFLYRGGGERLVTLMAKSLGADLISGFFSEGSFDPRELWYTGKIIPLGAPVFMKWLRHMMLKWRFIRHANILSEYDIVIFSGNCLDAIKHVRKDAKKIYYCHTPPRYLFDFRDQYLARIPFFVRPIFRSIFSRHAEIYKNQLQQFDAIFTNSENVHDRLLNFCGYESEVLYPPTDIHRFSPKKEEHTHTDPLLSTEDASTKKYFDTYYLSFCRLSPPKRVDVIVDAFLEMPEENLIFTYGKNDPLKDSILTKISGKKNILALESPWDDELIGLIRSATATIYIPIDEDFGMAPVESMACGTPVIGSNEGGLRETIYPLVTGKLIDIWDHDDGVAQLKATLRATSIAEWKSMRRDCILRAVDFSLEKFEKRLQSLLDSSH